MTRTCLMASVLLAKGAVVVVLAGAGCQDPNRPRFEQYSESTGAPASHAIHDERLRSLMTDLNRLAFERLPQEMDTTAMKTRRLNEIATIAKLLSADARRIPEALEGVRLGPDDRAAFVAFAEKLAQQSLDMSESARAGRMAELEHRFDALIETCIACHRAFRILPRLTLDYEASA